MKNLVLLGFVTFLGLSHSAEARMRFQGQEKFNEACGSAVAGHIAKENPKAKPEEIQAEAAMASSNICACLMADFVGPGKDYRSQKAFEELLQDFKQNGATNFMKDAKYQELRAKCVPADGPKK